MTSHGSRDKLEPELDRNQNLAYSPLTRTLAANASPVIFLLGFFAQESPLEGYDESY